MNKEIESSETLVFHDKSTRRLAFVSTDEQYDEAIRSGMSYLMPKHKYDFMRARVVQALKSNPNLASQPEAMKALNLEIEKEYKKEMEDSLKEVILGLSKAFKSSKSELSPNQAHEGCRTQPKPMI